MNAQFNIACYYFSNAGVDFSSTYSATDLLSTCYRYAVYIQTYSLQCNVYSLHHMMTWDFVCPMSSAHDTELKQTSALISKYMTRC